MKYKDIIGYSKPKKKIITEQKKIKPKKNMVLEGIKKDLNEWNDTTFKHQPKRWTKEFGGSGSTEHEKQLKEGRSEQEYLEHYEGEIFDAITQFKKVFERTEWKKHRGINKIIKDLYKLEQKLSNELGDL